MQRLPLFESDHFIYWKNRFEIYVKAKDLDLWHIILNGDFPLVAKNKVTQVLEVVLFEEQSEDLKKKLAKNNETKMVLYNALPKKEYERIFMCKTAKDIWQSLLITHQGNSQVKDNKIDLLVQQYEQFTIFEEESIDSGFARFNTIITSLKALDEGFSSKNYVRKFLRGKKERVKSIALKAKKDSSDDETLTFESDDEEYAMAKGKSDWKYFRCGDPNNLIGDCLKPSRNKDQKAFIGGSWSDSENGAEDKTNDETCLMAQSSNKVALNSSYYSHNASSLDNDKLNEKIKKLERSKEIEIACKSCEELKSENSKLKETQVKFDKSANSLRELLNNQKSPSCKIGLGFDDSKTSTSGTKNMIFVGSSADKATDGSTIKVHGYTFPGSVSRTYGEKGTEHVFSPPMSSRSDFVITRKKLIHNSIDESKKPSLKPSLKSGLGYVKTEPCMSPPIRRKYHNSVAFATGCKRIKKSKRCNRKIRIPIAMWPCRVEEKMTLKEVDGQTVEEIETKIIAKDGTITRVPGQFQGYETSEEEPVEQPRRHDLYGFVDHPQLQQGNPMNEFAPHRLPQPKGNMNGWLIEDEEEVERNEVDSDLESTASSKPMWKKTNKADHDRASRNCPWCSK
ncbi:hypothetical protein Tco_0351115 [Tanacetum coccineum]